VEFSVTIGYAISIRDRLICRYCDYTPAAWGMCLGAEGESIFLIRYMGTRREKASRWNNSICTLHVVRGKEMHASALLVAFV